MIYAKTPRQTLTFFIKCAAMASSIFLFSLACFAQNAPATQQPDSPWAQEMKKYPGLMPELGRLLDKLQHNIQFPEPRTESTLLPLLPASTMSVGAFPNYGGTADQVLALLHQELQESAVFRDWWQHGQLAVSGPKFEDALARFSQLHQYLGEEIVVSGATNGKDPSLLVVAEVRKPGLKKFLQQMLVDLSAKSTDKSKSPVRVLDLQDLPSAVDKGHSEELFVLVRPDFVVASLNLATLRAFNTRLAATQREFVSTPFAQRVLQEYQGGLTILAAADLHNILNQVPDATKPDSPFKRSGFADVKYLVWEHKRISGKDVSQMELSFSAPRHAAASWLANSSPLGSLDFVSTKALMAATVVLANPSQIFDDAKDLAGPSNSGSFTMSDQFAKALKLSLKDDLLNLLGGEITLELDNMTAPKPVWKAMLAVKDSDHLQQTLNKILATTKFEAPSIEKGGVTYHLVRVPNDKTTMDIGYAIVDGYLVIGSSRDEVVEAVRLHRSGESLAKSPKFLAALPPGSSLRASALFYEDPVAVTSFQLRQFAPEFAQALSQNPKEAPPAVVCVYGDEKTIREASTSPSFDAGALGVVAAIAIPNLLRSRVAANEASAVGSLRTVNTAEVTYEATYPNRGFASNLSALGEDPRGTTEASQDHAGLLGEKMVNAGCTADGWCTKDGYRFKITALCKLRLCSDYMAVATPTSDSTGTISFCTTSDGVIRSKPGSPLASALTLSQCKTWTPLQ